jgi:NADPH2:quinone reductase
VDTLFLDVVIRRGGTEGPWSVRPPYTPGAGMAGVVCAVGPGVDAGWLGRRVAAKSNAGGPRPEVETIAAAAVRTTPTGGYAERALARVAALSPVPDELSLPEAAALVNDGLTAMLLMRAAQVQPAERVLVTPAGGGLGCLLIQLAHAAGAVVVAAAGGRRKLEQARELGADVVVDYTRPGWATIVTEETGGVDVVLDGVGGAIGRASFTAAARGGRFLAFGVPGGGFAAIRPDEARAREVAVTSLLGLEWTAADESRLPAQAMARAAAGALRPVVGQTFPLADATEAHRAIEERRAIGKTLLLTRADG